MRSEDDIRDEIDNLKRHILNPRTKKIIRDDMIVRLEALEWVLQNAMDVYKERLKKVKISVNDNKDDIDENTGTNNRKKNETE